MADDKLKLETGFSTLPLGRPEEAKLVAEPVKPGEAELIPLTIGGTSLLPVSPLETPKPPEEPKVEPTVVTDKEATERAQEDQVALGTMVDERAAIREQIEAKQKELTEAQRKLAAGEVEPEVDISKVLEEEKFFIQFKRADGTIGISGPHGTQEGAEAVIKANIADGNFASAEVVGETQADVVKGAIGTIDQTFDITKEQTEAQEALDILTDTIIGFNQELDDLRVSRADASDALINSIQQTFTARRAQMADINRRSLASIRTFGIRGGTARFAPLIATGIVSAEERAGAQRLANLDAQEASLIAEAQIAQANEDFGLLQVMMENIKELRTEKVAELTKLKEAARKRNEVLEDRKLQLDRENAIGSLISQGITDPNIIKSFLGDAVSFEEIGDVLDTVFEARGQVREEARGVIEDFVPLLSAQLGDDPIENERIIRQFAQERGIDPEQLASGIIKFQTTQQPTARTQITQIGDERVLVDLNTGDVLRNLGPAGSITGIGAGFPNISMQDKINAAALAVEVFGKRQGPKMVPLILQEMDQTGATLDDIDDRIRLSTVSPEFTGAFKDAFGFVSKTGFSTVERTGNKDELDRLLGRGDTAGASDFILGLARDKADTAARKKVDGREDLLATLEVIESSLAAYIDRGGNTGLLEGTLEGFQQKVLRTTGDQELARISNEIAIAVQRYRQDLTGAAFTESEAKEYTAIFPNIGKTPELNQAKIDSLRSEVIRNRRNFFRRELSPRNYERLFDELIKPITTQQEGKIRVIRLEDNQEGLIPEEEFDPNIYKKVE